MDKQIEPISLKNGRNLKTGKAFESKIIASCKKYQKSGDAVIFKVPEPFAVLGIDSGGLFKGRFTASKALPDFYGTLKGGRSIMMEAKSTVSSRIMQNAITPKQWDTLTDHTKLGGLSFVIIEIYGQAYIIPWNDWIQMKELFGHKYISAQDASPYIIYSEKGNRIPFLNNILPQKNLPD